jgi:hypothetical protein
MMELLEATGVLGQFIRRCATDHKYQSDVMWLLDVISQCTELVKKKFKSGKACGDILNSILSGEDGYSGKRNEAVLSQLLFLQKLTTILAENKDFSGKENVCRNCNKELTLDATFFCCARCTAADYCSKRVPGGGLETPQDILPRGRRRLSKSTDQSQRKQQPNLPVMDHHPLSSDY